MLRVGNGKCDGLVEGIVVAVEGKGGGGEVGE